MKKNLLILMIALGGFSFSAYSQEPAVQTNTKPGWHKIAVTQADMKTDRDEVIVLGADHFKAIKLKVKDVPVEMNDLTVVYENETKQDIPVRNLIKAGGETREMDLNGKDRAIKKILLTYKTVPNAPKDRAEIEIWGLK